jgi:hypothetical protein
MSILTAINKFDFTKETRIIGYQSYYLHSIYMYLMHSSRKVNGLFEMLSSAWKTWHIMVCSGSEQPNQMSLPTAPTATWVSGETMSITLTHEVVLNWTDLFLFCLAAYNTGSCIKILFNYYFLHHNALHWQHLLEPLHAGGGNHQ